VTTTATATATPSDWETVEDGRLVVRLRNDLAGRDLRVMRSLESEHSILGKRCRRAQERLFSFSVAIRERQEPKFAGLEKAARTVLFNVHCELRECASPLEEAAAWELSNAKKWAIRAFAYVPGEVRAKKIEVELTQGEPLAICMGSQTSVDTEMGLLHLPVLGCRSVFPDATHVTGGNRMWRDWCDKCPPNQAQPLRTARREHKKRVDEYLRATEGTA
jgi:hypothetical protein